MVTDPSAKLSTPSAQLAGFIGKFELARQRHIRAARAAMRQRFPAANELVYDNYNFFVIGYGATERASDCFCSLAANAGGLRLCLLQGADLPDPDRILQGTGRQNRYVRLPDVSVLSSAPVEALLTAAAGNAPAALPAAQKGRLIIKSVSEKQLPRRKN